MMANSEHAPEGGSLTCRTLAGLKWAAKRIGCVTACLLVKLSAPGPSDDAETRIAFDDALNGAQMEHLKCLSADAFSQTGDNSEAGSRSIY